MLVGDEISELRSRTLRCLLSSAHAWWRGNTGYRPEAGTRSVKRLAGTVENHSCILRAVFIDTLWTQLMVSLLSPDNVGFTRILKDDNDDEDKCMIVAETESRFVSGSCHLHLKSGVDCFVRRSADSSTSHSLIPRQRATHDWRDVDRHTSHTDRRHSIKYRRRVNAFFLAVVATRCRRCFTRKTHVRY